MRRVLALALLLAGCDRQPQAKPDTPGARLEAAAVAAGMVPDPAHLSLTGSWARDTDRLCVVPGGREERIGVRVDYGDGQGCAASGTVRRSGGQLDVTFGACRFRASFEGDRIVFPAELPSDCDALCTGRASLAALGVGRLSDSASEAATLRDGQGRPLCAT